MPEATNRCETLEQKAAWLEPDGSIVVSTVGAPTALYPDEVRVDVLLCGICASDVSYAAVSSREAAVILGHELVGRVTQVGREVHDIHVGMVVVADPGVGCGQCEFCRSGCEHLCPASEFIGFPPRHGALQISLNVPARNCCIVPPGLPVRTAVLAEPLAVALHAINISALGPDDSVSILGAGPIGLLIAKALQHRGAHRVELFDPDSSRCKFAQSQGLSVGRWPPASGAGANVVFEATGDAEAPAQAIHLTKPGGHVVLIGIPRSEVVAFPHAVARKKGLSLVFSRRFHGTLQGAVSLLPQLGVDEMVTHVFPIEGAPEAFELAAAHADGVIKVAVGE